MSKNSKSFQNCAESEVPGYNDCPTFLFQVSNKKSSSSVNLSSSTTTLSSADNIITTKVRDISGNTKSAVSPPPLITKRKLSSQLDPNKNNDSNKINVLTKDELESRITELLAKESKLSEKEFIFYKNKVNNNIKKSLDNVSTVNTLSQIFGSIENDSTAAKRLLTQWMVSDTSIGTWCPAFIKIVDNIV
ncbi:similar to Saccharomyces cerevisiae YMR184W ADD37 Protein of unknown function involved in ER-associated protein degradation [Maudiozyma barnettii]|uniref:Uncharacterized protein n=1 Tax=Maudiozyma barnettii TaxID=61262 RepID=A0A8H2VEV9_9SACH|nr:Add37p [Kazachstania barnettii]CAB4254314.1 similar to Saccharomyces cerevisiae YMR184W ADD37 Protein of unknown function involved in ER-associated protein degradation [Kazachstania barnettii]CAD1782139.1 similar to Saccharomyces cerevisiae YMR184W ADD37 Protein of unknown function involved in ER-associated protein degradation [Kazachstania barnettii]